VIGLGIWLVQFLQVEVLILLQQYQKSIGIGNAILFWNFYWYWYCQYFLKVLLTTQMAAYGTPILGKGRS